MMQGEEDWSVTEIEVQKEGRDDAFKFFVLELFVPLP